MLLSACFHGGVGSQVGKVTRSGGVKKTHTYNPAIPVCIFSRLLNCRLARKQPPPEQQQKKRLAFNALSTLTCRSYFKIFQPFIVAFHH